MATSAARIPALESRSRSRRTRSASSRGEPRSGRPRRGAGGPPPPPDVPAGLPSDLLERRPDVREAEYAAKAANAGIGVTIGGFLPRIGLSAILGGVSPQLDSITSREGRPLVGRRRGDRAPVPRRQPPRPVRAVQGGVGGRQAPVPAGRAERLRRRGKRPCRAPEAGGGARPAGAGRGAYEEAVKLSTQRYSAGRASYFEVIQSQLLLFPAEVALAQTRRDQFTAVVQLYEALGGGWNLSDADWAGSGR